MTLPTMLYRLILGPLVLLFDVIYATAYHATGNAGLSILFLSLAMNLLVLPLYRRADAMQEEERRQSLALQPGVRHIKKTFRGNERFMMLQTFHRQHHYRPWFALKGSLSLLLEIPFFIAAYRFLSGLQLLQGVAFGPIRNLALPDGLLSVAGHAVNLLPILMTAINIASGAIYTRGMPLKSKVQLYGMALVFLVLLYASPAGLVFYWTLNNVFSLVKNVFYRLRNPKRALRGLCAALGLALLAFIFFIRPMANLRKQLILAAAALLLLAPLALHLIRRDRPVKPLPPAGRPETVLFNLCCAALTVLTGALIPSSVIRSSPAEFVNVERFRPPMGYIPFALLLAAGAFLVWGNIFYRLASPGGRRLFSFGALAAAGIGLMDFMLFGKGYGNMSAMMQFDTMFAISGAQYLINAAAVAALAAALYLLWRFRPALTRVIAVAAVIATTSLTVVNAGVIRSSEADISNTAQIIAAQGKATIPLDRSGRNVIVIMLDRSVNRFFPYLIEEKPELKRMFDGFTWFPNTTSYGNATIVGSPGLYGGYEYIPEQINRRTDETLVEKHNEALKVMPVCFLNAGYTVTLCDPSLAGYSTMPDLSVFDDYPDIRRFITKGRLGGNSSADADRQEAIWERNLFCYSVFRASPLLLHTTLYNNGLYNESNALIASAKLIQKVSDNAHATGVNKNFMQAYNALRCLPLITQVRDDGKGTFMMIGNDTAHDAMLLQEPEFAPADAVDNAGYDAAHAVHRTADGQELRLRKLMQITHYQCNMAALLQLGRWFDWMRENGVYDNTRIIIVSDHGAPMKLFDMRFGKGAKKDLLCYNAQLLFKDFDSHGLTVDETFMTNADTPTLALGGLIDDPVNPFTGNPITDDQKREPVQHIAYTTNWHAREYAGDTVFTGLTWLETRDSLDKDDWRVLGKGTLPPED